VSRAPLTRLLIMVAVGVLAVDAVLLLGAGYWMQRPALLGAGAVSAILAIAVLVSWRTHRRRLEEVDGARAELAAEARELARLTRDRS
jgi:hypothetical protein